MTAQTMAARKNENELARKDTISGNAQGAKKYAYFTTMTTPNVCGNITYINSPVSSISYIKESDPESFAKDEWPRYKSNFTTLNGGKKYFNWTNPVMVSPALYSKFTQGGDHTRDSFLMTTMTAYDDSVLTWKESSVLLANSLTYSQKESMIGTWGLAFPMSPGGSSIILEFGSDVSVQNVLQQTPLTNTAGLSDAIGAMPQMTVCNIYKGAIPYGGDNEAARNITQYVSFGMSADKTTPVEMNCGDNYITMFVYMPYHCFDNDVHNTVKTAAM